VVKKPKKPRRANTTRGVLPRAEAMAFEHPDILAPGNGAGGPENTEPLTDAQRDLLQEHAAVIGEISGWVMNRLRRKFGAAQVERQLRELVDDYTHRFAMHAARSWRPEGGATFSVYATGARIAILVKAQVDWLKMLESAPENILVKRAPSTGLAGHRRDVRSTREQERAKPVLDAVLSREHAASAADALTDLTPVERQVIAWRYGLDGAALSLAEVAERLRVTRSDVRAIEAGALQRLGALAGDGAPGAPNRKTAHSVDAYLTRRSRG
jgi:hypothetical protein